MKSQLNGGMKQVIRKRESLAAPRNGISAVVDADASLDARATALENSGAERRNEPAVPAREHSQLQLGWHDPGYGMLDGR